MVDMILECYRHEGSNVTNVLKNAEYIIS